METAPDGLAALKAAVEHPPDLILLDVVLPGIDGFEVCRRLRKLPATAQVPIIMLTSKSTIADKKIGFEAGADDYLIKPVEAAELTMRAAAQLRRAVRPGPDSNAGHPVTSRMVAIFGLRGGTGASSIAINLAITLCKLWGMPVPLLDLAMPVGVCDTMLNLRPQYRLDGLVAKSFDAIDAGVVSAFLTPHSSGVQLLAGLEDPVSSELLTDRVMALMLDYLRREHPLVVLDTAHDFSPATVAALDQAEVVILPMTPDLNSLRLAKAVLQVFKALGYEKELLLTVNCTFSKPGLSRAQIEKALNLPIHTVIPYAEGIWTQAINLGEPVLMGQADGALVTIFEDLAWHVSDPQMRQATPAQPSAADQRLAELRSVPDNAQSLEALSRAVRQHTRRLRLAIQASPEAGQPAALPAREDGDARWRSAELTALLDFVDKNDTRVRAMRGQLGDLRREFEADGRRLAQLMADLQDDVRRTRLLPISSVLDAYPRVVRDLARDLGKEVNLVVAGGDTEVDRAMLEQIKDPLAHLVRNSMDHGLEIPSARVASGKPPAGKLTLRAEQQGDSLRIEVVDDGAGIDVARVKASAIQRGLVTAEAAAAMSDHDALWLIFRSGLSTSPIITAISGRGVGLDVVRENIERLNGWIDVENVPGRGSRFAFSLPLTVATTLCLLAKAGGQTFGLPVSSVLRVVRVGADQIGHAEGGEAIRVDGRPVALTRLTDVLDIEPAATAAGGLPAIVVGGGTAGTERRAAFLVDALSEAQEVVVKSLPQPFVRVRHVSGAAILGSGEVTLIHENFDYPHVHLYLLDKDKHELVLAAAAGPTAPALMAAPARVPLDDDSLAATSARHQRLVAPSSSHGMRHPFLPQVRSGAAAPLHSAGAVSGVLEIVSSGELAFSSTDGLVLQTLADLVGVAVNNSRLYREMADLAKVDELTGLLNRRTLLSELESEWNRSQRYQRPLSLVLLDVDFFKQVNDHYGHAAGDDALTSIARLIERGVRQVDRVGRLGGDEFLLILPETPHSGALEVAGRLAIRGHDLTFSSAVAPPLTCTFSLGVASWPEVEAGQASELLQAADRALYRAKAAGRDQIGV